MSRSARSRRCPSPVAIDRVTVLQLLEKLEDRQALEEDALAQHIAPGFRRQYPDRAGWPIDRLLSFGLRQLWRHTAHVPLVPANAKMLGKFFVLEACYLYGAQHGPHCLGVADNLQPVPRPVSNGDAAWRLSLPEYLALIYADGNIEETRKVEQAQQKLLCKIGQGRDEDQTATVMPVQTLISKRKVALELLAEALIRWQASLQEATEAPPPAPPEAATAKAEAPARHELAPQGRPAQPAEVQLNEPGAEAAAPPASAEPANGAQAEEKGHAQAAPPDAAGLSSPAEQISATAPADVPIDGEAASQPAAEAEPAIPALPEPVIADEAPRPAPDSRRLVACPSQGGLAVRLNSLLFMNDTDEAELGARVAAVIQDALMPAFAQLGQNPTPARHLAQQLGAAAKGLIAGQPNQRLTAAALATAGLKCGVWATDDREAALHGLGQAGLIERHAGEIRFTHPLVTDLLAAEYLIQYAPERLLYLTGRPRLCRWAVEGAARARNEAVNRSLCEGLEQALPHLHPVSALDAAWLMTAFTPPLITASIREFGQHLAERLYPLGRLPSNRVHAALQQSGVPVIRTIDLFHQDLEQVIDAESLHSLRQSTDVGLLTAGLGIARSLLPGGRWLSDRQALLALIQEIAAGSTWERRRQCAAWLQTAALDEPLSTRWSRLWFGKEAQALDVLAEMALQRDVPDHIRLLARSVLATRGNTLRLLNRNQPEFEPLVYTLMLITGLRCEWTPSQQRWEPLVDGGRERAWARSVEY